MTNNNKKQTTKNDEGVVKMNNEQPVKKSNKMEEVLETMKAVDFKESNEYDVKKAEVVVSYMTEQMKLEHERKLVELEIKKLIEKHAQSVNDRLVAAESKVKMVSIISDTALRVGAIAAVTTITCIGMANIKEVGLEEIRLGAEK